MAFQVKNQVIIIHAAVIEYHKITTLSCDCTQGRRFN